LPVLALAAGLRAQDGLQSPIGLCSPFHDSTDANSKSGDFDRPVSWKKLAPNILCDQKNVFSFPMRLRENRNWVPAVTIVGATAGLVALDPMEGRYFHQTTSFAGFNKVFTSNATVIGSIVAPLSLYAAGFIRKDSKMQNTALLAGEAAADAGIIDFVLKGITKRARPASFSRTGNYWDSWYDGRGPVYSGKGGFPSGHTIVGFAMATVVAHRYREHKWVPYVAYGLAGAVGLSRLSLSAHFGSDVFLGAALGYCISRFAVLQYCRNRHRESSELAPLQSKHLLLCGAQLVVREGKDDIFLLPKVFAYVSNRIEQDAARLLLHARVDHILQFRSDHLVVRGTAVRLRQIGQNGRSQ
jgi:membrane-associated phospholipid phosphatase